MESKLTKKLINQNFEIIKQVGRVNSQFIKKDLKDNSIEILVLKEKIALKFNENIDVADQKNKVLAKIKILENKIKNLGNKLINKAYLKNAPKEIVQNDKILFKDLSVEENKLRSIVSSIN